MRLWTARNVNKCAIPRTLCRLVVVPACMLVFDSLPDLPASSDLARRISPRGPTAASARHLDAAGWWPRDEAGRRGQRLEPACTLPVVPSQSAFHVGWTCDARSSIPAGNGAIAEVILPTRSSTSPHFVTTLFQAPCCTRICAVSARLMVLGSGILFNSLVSIDPAPSLLVPTFVPLSCQPSSHHTSQCHTANRIRGQSPL